MSDLPSEPGAEPVAATSGDGASSGTEPVATKPVVARVFGRTDVGQIREHNEDNFLVADLSHGMRGLEATETQEWTVGRNGLLFAVCDGMGGAAAGEVASQMATDIVYEHMRAAAGHGDRDRLAADVVKSLEEAGLRILAEATTNRACRGMGTTATVAAVVDGHLLVGQVGDSRAYILRSGRLVQITRDQSLVNQLIEAGQLTEEEAQHFEHSNIILQALGTADSVQVDLTHVRLRKGDVLMLCSDGLSGMMRDAELRELMIEAPDPAAMCRELIAEANLAGGHDNVTVVVARFDGEGLDAVDDDATASLRYQKYHIPSWLDATAGETSKLRSLSADDGPSIEYHGEHDLDADIDLSEYLNGRSSTRRATKGAGATWWLWALLLLACGIGYAWYTR